MFVTHTGITGGCSFFGAMTSDKEKTVRKMVMFVLTLIGVWLIIFLATGADTTLVAILNFFGAVAITTFVGCCAVCVRPHSSSEDVERKLALQNPGILGSIPARFDLDEHRTGVHHYCVVHVKDPRKPTRSWTRHRNRTAPPKTQTLRSFSRDHEGRNLPPLKLYPTDI
ncbi:hypothetical protein HPB47_003072 [Ixodes persulcatus]|uniref:Uncharacterized protein n=1 Tax=Ixodes persulcatus TaxID=34615 RepID=A0AC60PKK1_IXOPE|nr:hypothetical protein HPB47_003072 [Ixodes persulcatus]